MNQIARYARIWTCLVTNSFKNQMSTSLASAGYLVGKLLRLGFFLVYLFGIFRFIPDLNGFGPWEVVLFFMMFNLVDVGSQFLFRGIYGMKSLIEEGDFDQILIQPAHALFRISCMNVDLLDLLTLIPVAVVTAIALVKIGAAVTFAGIAMGIILLGNALVISYAFHVFAAGMSVRTQELESAIWVYRDLMTLGRFPVSIYGEALRTALLSVVPIGIMTTFPAHALLGILSLPAALWAFLVAAGFHVAAQLFWRKSLEAYVSTSS